MIFDECHHARKNHPYNGIMREYFQVKDRPKIFGMTASPYWNHKNPALSLSTLETNLQCKIVGVHEHAEELQATYARLDEVILQYPCPPHEWTEFHSPTLYDAVKVYYANHPELFDQLAIPWLKMEMRYFMTLNNIGPYSASLYLFSEMQHHMAPILTRARGVDEDEMQIDEEGVQAEALDILEILDDYAGFFEAPNADDPDVLPIEVPLSWNSPKFRVLVDLILKSQKEDFQCIIFVEQRQTAYCLAKVLEATPELKDLIRCGYLVGQGMSAEGVSNQLRTFRGDPIKMFRERSINICESFDHMSTESHTL